VGPVYNARMIWMNTLKYCIHGCVSIFSFFYNMKLYSADRINKILLRLCFRACISQSIGALAYSNRAVHPILCSLGSRKCSPDANLCSPKKELKIIVTMQMSNFKAKMHQIRFTLGSAQTPLKELTAPQAASWI